MGKASVVVLGASGTVGRAMVRFLGDNHSIEVHAWNRRESPLEDFSQVRAKLMELNPSYVFNFALAPESHANPNVINVELPSFLNALTREVGFRLIHTSSVLVFKDGTPGPFFPETPPNADEGYGLAKRRAEETLVSRRGNAIVFRIGWQIAHEIGSNNMVDFLETSSKRGPIRASHLWFPSCSFVDDTVATIWNARDFPEPLYQVNANTELSFFDIVRSLQRLPAYRNWNVTRDDTLDFNQIMIDPRLPKLPFLLRYP